MLYKRIYKKPESSVLLLGPRGSGKSTFINSEVVPYISIDLLKSVNYRVLSNNPSELESMVAHLKPKSVVFLDEIQKIPELLDEVHSLIENRKLIFILTGSSARKLKKQGVNLLAGRALLRRMYPLSLKEIGSRKNISELLFRGTLPRSLNEIQDSVANDFLFTYVEMYLKEEIFQEGLTRNLKDFSRFIEMAGQYHGQILNFENIAKSIGKSGDTIKAWFQILEDTLVGYQLAPYTLNIFPRETKHPKFYFFDNGVARAAEGLRDLEPFPEKKGYYLESLIFNELKIYSEVNKLELKIFYYNVPSVGDIDFIIEVRKKSMSTPFKIITLEVKLSKNWNSDFEKMSKHLRQKIPNKIQRSLAVYLGERRLTKGDIEVLPLSTFVDLLWKGDLL